MTTWALLAGTMLWSTLLQAQGIFISGHVSIAKAIQTVEIPAIRVPAAGVTVRVKGTSSGVISDSSGYYRVAVHELGATLVYQAVGMKTLEIMVTDTARLDVQLKTDATELKELIITGYTELPLEETTGAYSTVKMDRISNTPLLPIDKALQGQVAGLQSMGGSGQPGSVQNIRIRGTGSINAGSEPLYVVNGILINTGVLARNNPNANTIAGIDINDIEQISILKDAAATSAYGSRAANGVIIITLKQGKSGKTSFRLSTETGLAIKAYSNPANRPLNTAEWRSLTAEGVQNRFPNQYPDAAGALEYVDQLIGVNPSVDTDWLREVTQIGKSWQYHLSATGGNDKTQFYISTGYLSQTGNVIATGLRRITGSISFAHTASKRLTFNTSIHISHTRQHGPDNGGAFSNPVLAAYFLRPSLAPRTPSGEINVSPPDFPAGSLYNPLAIADMDKRQTSNMKALTSFTADYNLFRNFKLTSRIGIDYNILEEDQYNNPFYGDEVNEQGKITRAYSRYFNWIWSNLATYHRAFTDYSFQVTAGYEAQKSMYYFNQTSVYGLPFHLSVQIPSAGSGSQSAEGSNSDYAFLSKFALLDFTYRHKWMFSGSIRHDVSSRFGSGQRSGIFWSTGLAWQLNKEEFLKTVQFIDQLKLRLSYGFNGNAAIGNYDWQGTYAYGKSYNYLGKTGSAPVTPGNNNLTWEFNKPLNLGLDMVLLNNRFTLVLDWYSRITSNLLINQPLPGTSGFNSYKNNAGSIRNQGLEWSISVQVANSKNFQWSIYLNASRNRNKIISLPGNRDIVSGTSIYRSGQDLQSFYMRQWAGVDPESGAPLWYTDATRKKTTKSYNEALLTLAGSASSKLYGSLGSTIKYKGFCTDFLFYFNHGNMIRDAWGSYTQSDGANVNFNVVAAQLNRWQKPGDQTDVPKYVYGGNNASNSMSSRFLYRGNYLRLRYVTISYEVPRHILSAFAFSGFKLFVRGTNLLTKAADKNLPYDPETNVNSTSNFDIFIPKTFTAGLQANF
ncbi:SusC/RagA family TonB-linked outer membrane protein [Dyadobacter sediminis]|uniref:SusC/RagA family TonB-linked outer membrane protein n=1 Tax=Dyadobacter sediminis TaxID=1493691 RepID=A0A5R9K6M4_9BACT|nr:SusC/RagA family TonB-linked outer membrane protein [Dyadobacter sediminis]TLU89440.1 SusC/RagA family TonB-linked outer membrane protein [Dyadobacter sediminis]GGC05403.1 SusC/RagA family TonB-linked outer membrane protein [Dyadobacter sediminis]